jgi:dipeptidyl aminopeptidase/acylaminoacyl peptidase
MSSFGTSDIGWHFWDYEMGDADPYADPARYLRFSPLTYAKNVRTPLLILHAENDYRCPIEQAEQLFTALVYLRKPVRMIRYPRDTHELTRGGKPSNRVHHMSAVIDWFDRHLREVREPHAEAAE